MYPLKRISTHSVLPSDDVASNRFIDSLRFYSATM